MASETTETLAEATGPITLLIYRRIRNLEKTNEDMKNLESKREGMAVIKELVRIYSGILPSAVAEEIKLAITPEPKKNKAVKAIVKKQSEKKDIEVGKTEIKQQATPQPPVRKMHEFEISSRTISKELFRLFHTEYTAVPKQEDSKVEKYRKYSTEKLVKLMDDIKENLKQEPNDYKREMLEREAKRIFVFLRRRNLFTKFHWTQVTLILLV